MVARRRVVAEWEIGNFCEVNFKLIYSDWALNFKRNNLVDHFFVASGKPSKTKSAHCLVVHYTALRAGRILKMLTQENPL